MISLCTLLKLSLHTPLIPVSATLAKVLLSSRLQSRQNTCIVDMICIAGRPALAAAATVLERTAWPASIPRCASTDSRTRYEAFLNCKEEYYEHSGLRPIASWLPPKAALLCDEILDAVLRSFCSPPPRAALDNLLKVVSTLRNLDDRMSML